MSEKPSLQIEIMIFSTEMTVLGRLECYMAKQLLKKLKCDKHCCVFVRTEISYEFKTKSNCVQFLATAFLAFGSMIVEIAHG